MPDYGTREEIRDRFERRAGLLKKAGWAWTEGASTRVYIKDGHDYIINLYLMSGYLSKETCDGDTVCRTYFSTDEAVNELLEGS